MRPHLLDADDIKAIRKADYVSFAIKPHETKPNDNMASMRIVVKVPNKFKAGEMVEQERLVVLGMNASITNFKPERDGRFNAAAAVLNSGFELIALRALIKPGDWLHVSAVGGNETVAMTEMGWTHDHMQVVVMRVMADGRNKTIGGFTFGHIFCPADNTARVLFHHAT